MVPLPVGVDRRVPAQVVYAWYLLPVQPSLSQFMKTLAFFLTKKDSVLELNILNILSMGASVSTIIGVIIALVTLHNLSTEKKNKTEYETKNAFYDGKVWTSEKMVWTIEGRDGDKNIASFELIISNLPIHNFSGEIIDNSSSDKLNKVWFFFDKSNRKTITLMISRWVEGDGITVGRAKIKFISPDSFTLTFIDDCMPHLPRETDIWPIPPLLDRIKTKEMGIETIEKWRKIKANTPSPWDINQSN